MKSVSLALLSALLSVGFSAPGDATLYFHCDNEAWVGQGYFHRHDNGCPPGSWHCVPLPPIYVYDTLIETNNWEPLAQVAINNVNRDTTILAECLNWGGPGGFIATIVCKDNPSETYSTKLGGQWEIKKGSNWIKPQSASDAVALPKTHSIWHRYDAVIPNNAQWLWEAGNFYSKTTQKFKFKFEAGQCGANVGGFDAQPVVDPIGNHVGNEEWTLKLTSGNFMVLSLVVLTVVSLAVSVCLCFRKRNNVKYVPVKAFADSESEEV